MWNPFAKVSLEPVIRSKTTEKALGSESTPEYQNEIQNAKMRSLLARTQITMIHEALASSALNSIRGDK